MKNLAIEIFCGGGTFSKVASSLGYEVISLDNRRRKGICEPTLKTDILKVQHTFFKSLQPKVMWFGLPCDIWSFASGGFHLDKNFKPKTEKAKVHLKIFDKTIQIIKTVSPGYFFIENPRGNLQKYPPLLAFLKETNSFVYECTLSSYGFPTTKPTIIISNFPNLKLKPLDAFGRGAKNKGPGTFSNLTKVQRQATPKLLIKDILKQIE